MYPFLIVIEKTDDNYTAHSPDLPGCVAAGTTREEVEHNMREAIQLHVQSLLEDNLPVPDLLFTDGADSTSSEPSQRKLEEF
ncbi:MAG: type II toxin-antitoxin system HicB family antitoxin [Pseudomonadota bacterium]